MENLIQYRAAVLAAATSIIGRQEAEDLCQQFWLDIHSGQLIVEAGADESWFVARITDRTRKAANRRFKDGIKHLRYTENPSHPTTPGEISDEQLEKLCSKVDLPEVTVENRLLMMKNLFEGLPLADQEFLKAYHQKKAEELIPKYGCSRSAIWKRASRLKKRLTSSLAGLYARK